MIRIWKALLFSAGLLLLAGCQKVSPDGLQGRWKPVYASMDYVENGTSHCSCDGPVDETGRILMLRESINHPDVKYEDPILITGIRFYTRAGCFHDLLHGDSQGEDRETTHVQDGGWDALPRIADGRIHQLLSRSSRGRFRKIR